MSTTKQRSWEAQIAQFRNSAGYLHDRRQKRGGAKNQYKDLYDLIEEEKEIEDELDYVDEE